MNPVDRVVQVITDVSADTGYGPTHRELAEVLSSSPNQIPGLREALRRGRVRYDDDGRLWPVTKVRG